MYKLNIEKMFFDMADNQAIVIDFTTGIYYAMNSLGSLVFEYLTKGVSINSIEEALKDSPHCPSDIGSQMNLFIEKILEKELLIKSHDTAIETIIIPDQALLDGFTLEINSFADAQEIMMADPMHDVEIDQGWPVLKPVDSND